jgi:hypothetical protein
MIEETKKSIQNILSQRISSPFYGALLVSWVLWNWKIVYLTFFVSEKAIKLNKIDYIINNYSGFNTLILFPFLSTIVILTVIPFLTNAAFWLDLNFNKWRIDKKINVEKKQLLTVEKSISLREQLLNMENRFETLLSDKNAEIIQLKAIINELEKKPEVIDGGIITSDHPYDDIENLAIKITNNESLNKANKIISHYINGGFSKLVIADNITTDIMNFYITNNLIETTTPGMFRWTNTGTEVNKLISKKAFD